MFFAIRIFLSFLALENMLVLWIKKSLGVVLINSIFPPLDEVCLGKLSPASQFAEISSFSSLMTLERSYVQKSCFSLRFYPVVENEGEISLIIKKKMGHLTAFFVHPVFGKPSSVACLRRDKFPNSQITSHFAGKRGEDKPSVKSPPTEERTADDRQLPTIFGKSLLCAKLPKNRGIRGYIPLQMAYMR